MALAGLITGLRRMKRKKCALIAAKWAFRIAKRAFIIKKPSFIVDKRMLGIEERAPIAAKSAFIAAAFCASFPLPQGLAQIPCSYEVAAIIQGPPCPFGIPNVTTGAAISPNGEYVVGSIAQPDCDSGGDAFIYIVKTGQLVRIPRPGDVWDASASDVNDAGWVCGSWRRTSVGFRGFLHNVHTGEQIEVQPAMPGSQSGLNAINASGQTCGWRSIGPTLNPYNAFVYELSTGQYTDIGLIDGLNTTALDINDSGSTVGHSGNSGIASNARAFLYENERLKIFGPVPGAFNSVAAGITNGGHILIGGAGQLSPVVINHVFVYQDGSFSQVVPLTGFRTLQPRGMNNSAVCVGNSGNQIVGLAPTIWFNGVPFGFATMVTNPWNLNIQFGRAIDDQGVILAHGNLGNAIVSALLVPQPKLLGDTNCDELINVDDLIQLLGSWGSCSGCSADFTHDGTVNSIDLEILLKNWTLPQG